MININWQNGIESFIDAISSGNATPGGGAAAAVTASIGCGLTMMAISITMKMKSTTPEDKKLLNAALDELIIIRDSLKAGAEADAKAYEDVVRARKLPVASREREINLKEALKTSADVPASTARVAVKALEKTESVEGKIAKVIISDIVCAKLLLKTGIACCVENINANMPYIDDEVFKSKMRESLNFLAKFC